MRRIPRKTKKFKGVISVDIAAVPAGWDMDHWFYVAKHGLAVWDSTKGKEPRLIGRDYKRFKTCDLHKNNINIEKWKK
jgi:hypothetical protein